MTKIEKYGRVWEISAITVNSECDCKSVAQVVNGYLYPVTSGNECYNCQTLEINGREIFMTTHYGLNTDLLVHTWEYLTDEGGKYFNSAEEFVHDLIGDEMFAELTEDLPGNDHFNIEWNAMVEYVHEKGLIVWYNNPRGFRNEYSVIVSKEQPEGYEKACMFELMNLELAYGLGGWEVRK